MSNNSGGGGINNNSSSKNVINGYNNNLLQENAKLRKLLTLQQKAIAFRRANLWNVSELSNSAVVSNGAEEDEDVTTSAAVDNLPEDSKSVGASVSSTTKSPVGLQCVYCPKIFNDSTSFAKHLSLRHMSSSIDDGLPSSIISSGASFLQRLQQQYHKSYIHSAKSNNDQQQHAHNQVIIDRLQEEIGNLKAKLTETEQSLKEEKFCRQSFESGLKSDLEQNVRLIQEKLTEKIDEVKFLRNEALVAADQATNANRTANELINRINTNQMKETKHETIQEKREERHNKSMQQQRAEQPKTNNQQEMKKLIAHKFEVVNLSSTNSKAKQVTIDKDHSDEDHSDEEDHIVENNQIDKHQNIESIEKINKGILY